MVSFAGLLGRPLAGVDGVVPPSPPPPHATVTAATTARPNARSALGRSLPLDVVRMVPLLVFLMGSPA
jgi:hypothetical protein